jgi:CubicO group peptidase (beta-lactamase class C family)
MTGPLDELAERIVRAGVAPLCATGCAARAAPENTATASTGWKPEATPGMETVWRTETGGAIDVLFDLASLTKPLTAVAVACSGIDRRTPLGDLLVEARGTPSERVPLELFLAHRAGLDAHRPLFEPLVQGKTVDSVAALLEAASARRPDAVGEPPPDGFPPLYSDLGYMLAGEALARAVGARDAGEAIERLVIEPLGMGDRLGTVRELRDRGAVTTFAPTENVPWRGGVVAGAVHDENAWALTGYGASGHAGLFGTVGSVVAFGRAVLDAIDGRSGPLGGFDLRWITQPRNDGATLRAGFDGKSSEGSSAGTRLGPASFGHLGFTGTSVWIDPDSGVVVSLLTNRVHPSRENMTIREVRPWAHDALWELARATRVATEQP